MHESHDARTDQVSGTKRIAVILLIVVLVPIALNVGSISVAGQTGAPDPACVVHDIARAADLPLWSPAGDQFLLNKKDAQGTYQLYVGKKGGTGTLCISCSARPNSPMPRRHKLQAHWHPSGQWIVLAAERDNYNPPLFSTPDLIEGWIQSGLFVDIYATRPNGSEWFRLSNFGGPGRPDGFTGVAFTPDGSHAVWAQIVSGNIFQALFGTWELILADFQEVPSGVPSLVNQRNITPAGAKWVEPGNFGPDGKSLLISADIGLSDPQGQDQFILDITNGSVRNVTNTPDVWDEHGVFSPDGEKIFFMSSYPYRSDPLSHTVLFIKTEFMLINKDGSGIQQVTHFNVPGYPESNAPGRGSTAAIGGWSADGRSIAALNLFFPIYETWNITFNGSCGVNASFRARQNSTPRSQGLIR
jgi:hypothetical protein